MATLNLSGASSINASCFNSTQDEAYDDLRARQAAVTTRIREVARLFDELKVTDGEGVGRLNEEDSLQ